MKSRFYLTADSTIQDKLWTEDLIVVDVECNGLKGITLTQDNDIIVLDEKQTKQLIRELIGEFK